MVGQTALQLSKRCHLYGLRLQERLTRRFKGLKAWIGGQCRFGVVLGEGVIELEF